MKNIIVTICCMTYNHEKYIEKTLQGFVSQKTDFKYEVIIHDDASTDGTAEIIKKYVEQYPNLFVPIYQTENQHSKNVKIMRTFVVPKAKGKYIALCEGDDFWDDEFKLQKQVDILEQNPDIHMCVHKTREVQENGMETGETFPNQKMTEGRKRFEDFFGLGYAFHTSSFMFRGEQWREYFKNRPDYCRACDVGDEAYLLYFAQLGGLYYIDSIMSNYRRGVPSSWSARKAKDVTGKRMSKHAKAMFEAYRLYDKYTEKKYHELLLKQMMVYLSCFLIIEKHGKRIFKKENKEYFLNMTFKWKLYMILSACFPTIMKEKYLERLSLKDQKNGYL